MYKIGIRNFSLLICLTFTIDTSKLFSQSELLPQGVGIFQYGYRSYTLQVAEFNEKGNLVSLGDRFNKELKGEKLLEDQGDLGRLAKEIAQFDNNAVGEGSLVRMLDLGTLQGQVESNISAQIFGLAYGVLPYFTFFMGFPYISANVKTKIELSGNNTALQVKDRLGELGFEELNDGLIRASRLSTETIKNSFIEKGYAPIDYWEEKNYGDLRMGGRSGFDVNSNDGDYLFGTTVASYFSIPTGYQENPDILTDVSFGSGYSSFNLGLLPKMTLMGFFSVGVEGNYGLNFPAQLQKRVPEEDEETVDASRKTKVTMTPGNDWDVNSQLGASISFIEAGYKFGKKTHLEDAYSGTLAGNYKALSEDSDKEQVYQELSIAFSTIKAFRQKKFFYPFVFKILEHRPLMAKNYQDELYYEFTFSGFFSTPWKEKESSIKKQRPHKKKRKNKRRYY